MFYVVYVQKWDYNKCMYLYLYLPVWWIVKTMPRDAVDSSMHYCPRPQGRGQLCIELSTVPRGIVLIITQPAV